MTKEEAYNKATLENLGTAEGTRMDIIYAAMEIYSRQMAIAFNEFIKDNSYTKGDKGWYKYYEQRKDFPSGFSMSTPVYEFLTIDELYNLFLQHQSQQP